METRNRFFNPKITLIAPTDGFELQPRYRYVKRFRTLGKSCLHTKEQTVFEGNSKSPLRSNRRGMSYPVMALMINKKYGNVKAAMQQMVVSDMDVEHGPILKRIGEDEYICEHFPAGEGGLKTDKQPTFDPTNEESIGKQLSAGTASKAGDSFFWSTTIQY